METILANLSDKYRDRFVTAVKTLDDGMAAILHRDPLTVRQVVYNEAKFIIGRAVEEAATKLAYAPEVVALTRAPGAHSALYEVVGYVQAHTASAMLKKLKPVSDLPALTDYIKLVRETAVINTKIKALKPFLIKGRAPSTPLPRSLENLGTCAICGHKQKLTKGQRLVDHGFKISDGLGQYIGFRSGKCFGVRYLPFELSNEANIAYERDAIDPSIADERALLAKLQENTIETFHEVEKQRIPGSRSWERQPVRVEIKKSDDPARHEKVRLNRIRQSEDTLRNLDQLRTWNRNKITTWKATPLPGAAKAA